MAQKYKVFFNDRLLLLAHPEDAPKEVCKDRLRQISRKKIGRILEEFEFSGVQNFCICYTNPEELFRQFQTFYLLMEAAGGVVCQPDGRSLFIKRFGKWDLPKGKIESGESPEQAAMREVSEECGIRSHRLLFQLPPTYHTYTLEGVRILKKTWWFAMGCETDEKTIPQTEEGITEAVWMVPAQVDMVLNNTYRSLVELINDIPWDKFNGALL